MAPFLQRAMDPPPAAAVANALSRLAAIGALDSSEDLTALGGHLARLPVDPAVGKLLVFGAIFDCLEPILSIAASLADRSPFVMPLDRQKEADQRRIALAQPHRSDHWALLTAVRKWQQFGATPGTRNGAAQGWARSNFLLPAALDRICNLRRQLAHVRSGNLTFWVPLQGAVYV